MRESADSDPAADSDASATSALAERWEDLVEESVGGPVSAGQMFGSKGLRTGRKFFAIWWQENLVLKLPQHRIDGMVAAGDGHPFAPMEGRVMGGWVVLNEAADWPALAADARAHVAAQNA